MNGFLVVLIITAVTAQQGMQMPPMMGGMRVGQYDGMAGGMQSGRGGVMMGSYGAKDDQGGNMGGMDDMRQISAMGRMRRVSEGLNGKATKSESSEVSGKSLERNETLKNDTAHTVTHVSDVQRLNDTLRNDSNGRQLQMPDGKENNTTSSKGQQTTGSQGRHRRQATSTSKTIGTLGYDGGDYGDDWDHGGHGGHGGHGCDGSWDHGHGSWSSSKKN
ncbi:harpin HrpN-like [Diachasmimorpha longicaudata]|uniref:harpin HrpN-like n=1 Tax=Diachasmimorpha longicaudata TaxID=58733 RepID=UPI0030B8ED31